MKNLRKKPGIPHCRMCRENNNQIMSIIKYIQCQHLIYKKCSKSGGNASKDYICSECIAENIPFSKLENNDITELCFNSNFSCKCLTNKKNFIRKSSEIKLLNLKELNFKSNWIYMQTDPDEQLADPTQFGYYTTHDSTNELKNQI